MGSPLLPQMLDSKEDFPSEWNHHLELPEGK